MWRRFSKFAGFRLLTAVKKSSSQRRFLTAGFVLTAGSVLYVHARERTFTAEQVADHRTPQAGIWVTYGDGVYDITSFVSNHPGGKDTIMMAAGGALEPFWKLYGFHKTPEIIEILEEYRIGALSHSSLKPSHTDNDPYSTDPIRHPSLQVRSEKPFNAEPPLSLLAESYQTPNDLFFVRNHLPVPNVDPASYELLISGHGVHETRLSLSDLKSKFGSETVTVTLQCAGNRRDEMNAIKQVRGLAWGAAAISTATFTGPRLIDILNYCRWTGDDRVQHVVLEGLDVDISGVPYGASIPRAVALSPDSDVIIAYEMNGSPLPRDHGFPVRLVAPGIVGARNVKWLSKIILSEEESDSQWQQRDYKGFSPSTDWDTVDFSTAPAIQETPVQSAICTPSSGATLTPNDEGCITVKGYAFSGGKRNIVRVDVTADGGKTWHTAKLIPNEPVSQRTATAWKLWHVDLPVKTNGPLTLTCKAVDVSYNSQPDNVNGVWNLRGVLNNSWHRVNVNITT